jgi:type VI secretion system protein ImpL
MKKLFGWLFHPLLLVLIGLACLASIIWFGGPLLAFADWRPLESERVRWITIAAVVGFWLLRRIWKAARAHLTNRKLLDALGAGPRTRASASEPPDPNVVSVRERFARAMAVMQATPMGHRRGLLDRLFSRSRYVYQLPWYVFIGPPGSGKTTALLNAGLEFPLAKSLGNDPVRGIAGTRHCDWWFTDRAVLIDTAGRYTTQDSDTRADAGEWAEFLVQLKKYRPRQPINGALVTISVADLLTLPEGELAAQAVAVRARVSELLTTLDNRFPVYVLVTKADLLAGFNEFFDGLDRDQRAQVWGTTFAFDERGSGAIDAGEFVARFDALVRRIDALTLDRLQAERDPARRAAIFGFAHQLAALRAPLQAYLTEAFPVTGLAREPLVRGVYLASGTQEGTPIDRVIAALTRNLGMQRRALAPMRPSGRAYFLQRLLNDVVFAEAGIAGTNLQWERQLGRAKWSAAAIALTAGLAALGAWTYSYLRNVEYVDSVAARTSAAMRAMPTADALRNDLGAILQQLTLVRGLARTADVDPRDPKLSLQLGLFQGDKLDEAADQAYQRLLAQSLGPAIGDRLTRALSATPANAELRYETLKAAMMLLAPGRLDRDAVKGWIAFDLETSPPVLDPERRAALLGHVDELLERNALGETLDIDDRVIARVRQSLIATPLPQRVYNRLKRQRIGAGLPEFRITQAGGPSASAVFARSSGRPVTEGVAGLYTYDGYHKTFASSLDSLVKDLATEEVWVLGIQDSNNARRAQTPAGRDSLVDEVKRLYLNDYAETWDRFVLDITLVPSASLAQSIQTARILSAPDSPLVLLLRAIVREVTLTAVEQKQGVEKTVDNVVGKVGEAARAATDRLGQLVGPRTQAPIGPRGPAIERVLVDDRFQNLRNFVQPPAPGAPAPMDKTIGLLNEVYTLLVATETAVRSGNLPPPNDVANKVRADGARLPEPIRSMVTGLAAAGNSQALGATRQNLSQNLATSVGEFCVKAITERYPFAAGSARDVTPEDFARLFGPAGIFDEFFQKSLSPLVDTSVRPWRFRKVGEASIGGSPAALLQFERAAVIRNVFFVAGRGPALRVEFRPVEMDPAILQLSLDIDGQALQYAHGPVVPRSMTWPGAKGSNQIRMQISPPGPSGGSGLLFEGAWALHRMFDRARIEPTGQPERFRATFNVDGRRVVFEVTAGSVTNPFRMSELQQFQCPRSL